MKPQEALNAMCNRCHKNPFRNISDDHCEEYETIKRALAKAKALDIIKDKAAAFELLKGNVLYIRCSEEWATNLHLDDEEAKTIKEALK